MILTLRLQNAFKLATAEDPLYIHKTLGILCFLNYVYRFGLWLFHGAGHVYAINNELLFWIACHSMLSLSSLIFHLPKKRVRGSPVIWPEFRMHSILFAMRSLLVMLTHALIQDPTWSYGIRSTILMGTMVGADLTTHFLGSQEKTMRGMPFPPETTMITKNRVNMYYSICQVLATTKMIYSAEPPYQIAEPFFILFPIQLAAFLMTLVKKGIMTTEGWHFYYALFLGINFIYSAMIPFSQNRFPVIAASVFFCITRFRFRFNKYLLWLLVIVLGFRWINETDLNIWNLNDKMQTSTPPPLRNEGRIFKKDPIKSLGYMFLDGLIIAGLFLHYDFFASHVLLLPLYWNLMGFYMWCLFVVGHDCGHGSFSDSTLLNDVCGHLCHAPILVPYYPWQLSHRHHHTYHNHVEKDRSHPWIRKEKYDKMNWMQHAFMKSWLLVPIKFTLFYLWLGIPDGSHINPLSPLFETVADKIKCMVSTFSTAAAFLAIYWLSDCNPSRFFSIYIIPILIFNFWLTMVTFLQHHHEDTIAYGDKTWTFAKGGSETIDRSYGIVVDTLSHHITSDHVVHHLFPGKIPHYHLKEATRLLRNRFGDKYTNIPTYNFLSEFTRLYPDLQYMVETRTDQFEFHLSSINKKME